MQPYLRSVVLMRNARNVKFVRHHILFVLVRNVNYVNFLNPQRRPPGIIINYIKTSKVVCFDKKFEVC